jgi:DNA topoisomerase IA
MFAVFRRQSILGHTCFISEIEEKDSEQAATGAFRTCTIQNECATQFILGNKLRLMTEIHEILHQGNKTIAENSILG